MTYVFNCEARQQAVYILSAEKVRQKSKPSNFNVQFPNV